MKPGLLKIGKLAKLADVLPSTIHYYTVEGLLHAADYSRGGYRLYHPAAVERVQLIQRLQQAERLTIAEIRVRLRRSGSR